MLCCDVLVVCLTRLVIDEKGKDRSGGNRGREEVLVVMVMSSRQIDQINSRKERREKEARWVGGRKELAVEGR